MLDSLDYTQQITSGDLKAVVQLPYFYLLMWDNRRDLLVIELLKKIDDVL